MPMHQIAFLQERELDELETFVGSKTTKSGARSAVNHFKQGILGWVLGDHSAKTFEPLWAIVSTWQCYFYVTDGWSVYPGFIPEGDQIISKTYMTRVEGENTRLRHYLARLHRKTLCYSFVRENAEAQGFDCYCTISNSGMSQFLNDSYHYSATPNRCS